MVMERSDKVLEAARPTSVSSSVSQEPNNRFSGINPEAVWSEARELLEEV